MRYVISALAALFLCPAHADKPWVFEWEFGYLLERSTARVALPSCTKVISPEYVQWYAVDPRPGWELSCGGRNPLYTHFLGRRIARPLDNLELYVGWRHRSSPFESNEIEWDTISVKGRFTWGN